MAKFIKTIVDRINLANRKGLCPYYTPDQICEEVHAESMNLWIKYAPQHQKSSEIELYLRPFRDSESIFTPNGEGVLVNGKAIITFARSFTDKKITIYTIDKFSNAVDDSIVNPTADYPIMYIR